MLTQKQAKKLGRPMVIDLREINAKEYIEKKHPMMKYKNKFLQYFGIIGFVWFIIVCSFGWGIFEADAKEPKITYENLYVEGSDKKPPFKIYSQLKDECYTQEVNDKEHCIKTGLSIAYAESTWKDNHTPFGLQSKDKSYKKWVSSYKNFWYTANDGHFFYGDWGQLGRSHYCTSEESSGSKKGCPNGRVNFDSIYFNLKF